MKKLIIKFDDNIEELKVLEFIQIVIKNGRISKNKSQFSYVTTINNRLNNQFIIYSDKTKKSTDVFIIQQGVEIE